jgi:HK97 gp10 family phage protein
MSKMFKYKIEGFEDMSKFLRELPSDVENKILQSAVNAAAKEGLKEIKRVAPNAIKESRASHIYGKIIKNLKVRTSKLDKRPGQRGAFITTGDSFWALFYEIGTKFQQARPFFGPAFNRSQEKMLDTLQDNIADGIDKLSESKKK